MAVVTYEGVVENSPIRLNAGMKLPEGAKVYVVIPDLKVDEKSDSHFYAAIGSPRTGITF